MSPREITNLMLLYFMRKGKKTKKLAKEMSSTIEHIEDVLNEKSNFTAEDIDNYSKNNNMKFWEFAIEVLGLDNLPEKSKNKVMLCKELDEIIKKKKDLKQNDQ